MIRLVMTHNRDVLNFVIRKKEIFYCDRIWGHYLVRCLPPQEDISRVIALSRNKIPASFISLFKFTPEEIKEYESAKNEEELAQIIIKDAASRGVILRNKEVVNGGI